MALTYSKCSGTLLHNVLLILQSQSTNLMMNEQRPFVKCIYALETTL